MNTSAPWPQNVEHAEGRVLVMQKKLHRWATQDPQRCFDDLFNLVYDPAFLMLAWDRVRSNKGGRTPGVDGQVPRLVLPQDVLPMLARLRRLVKTGEFTPVMVRQHSIPKAGGKVRRLGIPTMRDRIVQASLKLVLEPIFEAGFYSSSYGFRPRRRAQDAIAEIHHFTSAPANYEWVFEADITACFDEIDHDALIGRIRERIKDKKVVGLIRAFLKAGVLSEDGVRRDTYTGTPQGGILSPLLANIALSGLDEHFRAKWQGLGTKSQRQHHRNKGGATMKLIRYADDFVILVKGTRTQAHTLWEEVAHVLAPIGLRLSAEKTRLTNINEGFDFLGWHIKRRKKKGTQDQYRIYTYASKKSLRSIITKIRSLTHRTAYSTLAELIQRINPVIRGWCEYFRHGVSKRTFGYVDHYVFWRVYYWIRKRHLKLSTRTMIRRHLPGWEIQDAGIHLFRAHEIPIVRYRYRGSRIPTPWDDPITA